MGAHAPYLSVVVPVYNEEENVARLHERIAAALDAAELDYEVIYVDDGSRDRSFILLRRSPRATRECGRFASAATTGKRRRWRRESTPPAAR